MRPHRFTFAAVLAALGTLAGAAPLSGPKTAPGTVVRWDGKDLDVCGRGAEEWPPLADACWYAFDLDAKAGSAIVWRQRGGRREEATVTLTAYPYPTQRLTVDERKVHPRKEDLARIERESAAVAKLWQIAGPARFTLPLATPLAKLPTGGRFGARRIFNGEARSPHSGADYAAPVGTPVLAPADGTVVLAADHFFSGKSVFLHHGGGLFSMSFHLSAIEVKTGDEVRRGQRIGAVGATGRVTGPHLHFGLRWHGARVDPSQLLADPQGVAEIPRVTLPETNPPQ